MLFWRELQNFASKSLQNDPDESEIKIIQIQIFLQFFAKFQLMDEWKR